jgi:hypothetical protein
MFWSDPLRGTLSLVSWISNFSILLPNSEDAKGVWRPARKDGQYENANGTKLFLEINFSKVFLNFFTKSLFLL